MGDAADDLYMREQNERLPYSDFNPRGYKKTVRVAQPKPELSLSEILTKLENAVEYDLKMRMAGQSQRPEPPKQVHAEALHSLQVRLKEAYQKGWVAGKDAGKDIAEDSLQVKIDSELKKTVPPSSDKMGWRAWTNQSYKKGWDACRKEFIKQLKKESSK